MLLRALSNINRPLPVRLGLPERKQLARVVESSDYRECDCARRRATWLIKPGPIYAEFQLIFLVITSCPHIVRASRFLWALRNLSTACLMLYWPCSSRQS